MSTKNHLLLLILVIFTITGCATSGAFNAGNLTNVELSEGNYKVVATNVKGEASAEYIFGVSAGVNSQTNTFALARISGTGLLYGEALENLWTNFGEQHGDIKGRNLALVNVHYDTDAVNLLLYTKPTVSIYADVVEFGD